MGVDYSAGFGYGILLDNKKYKDVHEDGLYEYAEQLCHDINKNFDVDVSYLMLGNGMSDDFAAVIGYNKSFDLYDTPEEFSELSVSNEQKFGLLMAAVAYDLPHPSWYGGLYVY